MNASPLMFTLLLLLCTACGFFHREPAAQDDGQPVARVHDTYLYKKDLGAIFTQGTHPRDSASLVQRYIDSWIRKQLLFHQAQQKANIDMSEINKRVEEYKYQLLIYAYQKQYIEENLDTVVTEQQIQAYYQQYQQNFELKQSIVKALFVKVPAEAPKTDRLRQWMVSEKPADFEQLKSYCYTFAKSYSLNDTLWIALEQLVKSTPFDRLSTQGQGLQRRRLLEESDQNHLYLMIIRDFKIADQLSPLPYIKNQIVEIILNKRKVALQQQYEQQLFEQGAKNKDYEIF